MNGLGDINFGIAVGKNVSFVYYQFEGLDILPINTNRKNMITSQIGFVEFYFQFDSSCHSSPSTELLGQRLKLMSR